MRKRIWSSIRELAAILMEWVDYPSSKFKKFTCFHCGFVPTSIVDARGHFGEYGDAYTICMNWAELNADGKLAELQEINGQLLEQWEETVKLRQQVETLEFNAREFDGKVRSRFNGCDDLDAIYNEYHTMEGRALAAEERLKAIGAYATYEVHKLQEPSDQIDLDFGMCPHGDNHLAAACYLFSHANVVEPEKKGFREHHLPGADWDGKRRGIGFEEGS